MEKLKKYPFTFEGEPEPRPDLLTALHNELTNANKGNHGIIRGWSVFSFDHANRRCVRVQCNDCNAFIEQTAKEKMNEVDMSIEIPAKKPGQTVSMIFGKEQEAVRRGFQMLQDTIICQEHYVFEKGDNCIFQYFG